MCYDESMIGSLKGTVALRTEKFFIIDVAGVGYKVYVSPETLSKTQGTEEVLVFVHTHVREDAIDLYGFLDMHELHFFEMLLNVSGIGPRSALAILGVAAIETLEKAIGSGDTSYLTKISGIGKKTAEKIIIELRDKMGTTEGAELREELDALEALTSLGYSQHEAREALKKITATDTNSKVREALKILGNK